MLRSSITLNRYALMVQNHKSNQPLHFEEETSRLTDIKIIKKEEKKVKIAIIEKNIKRKEVMENPKKLTDEKDKHIVMNSTYNSLALGFISTKDKHKYIELNADNFKALNPPEQRQLFNLFLTYLN